MIKNTYNDTRKKNISTVKQSIDLFEWFLYNSLGVHSFNLLRENITFGDQYSK